MGVSPHLANVNYLTYTKAKKNTNIYILFIGDSGSGKSVSLRFVEQQLTSVKSLVISKEKTKVDDKNVIDSLSPCQLLKKLEEQHVLALSSEIDAILLKFGLYEPNNMSKSEGRTALMHGFDCFTNVARETTNSECEAEDFVDAVPEH
ncbi:unnamed protein product [Didymodactylos carnosus]|uniref:Uncharacterized protein n=1 Tax=Didymodactylos carnosus TaxID=1234261 RepID=A0A8S2MKL8_9BILA|nr:unnamed protein product [Didymodactylos carnosus]CAF3963158.1 unnamed protein product [Didymodactylos carnosus]